MSADGFDAVVVGAGPNGLSGAITLAEAGRRVLLLEAAERIGGALRCEALTLPGFVHDVGATVMPLSVSEAFRAIRPEAHGMSWAHPPIPVGYPLEGSPAAAFVYRSLTATALELGRDGRGWQALVGATARAGLPLVDSLMSPFNLPRAPASLVRYGIPALLPTTVLARAFREQPARALFAGMAAHSKLDLSQVITSGYAMLMSALAHTSGWPVVAGGSERLAEALAGRFLALGGEIRTGVTVRSLADVPPARAVLLNLTPRQVLSVAGDRLPARYRTAMARYRYGSGVFKVDWALDAPVPWRDPRLAGAGTVHVGGTLAEIAASERAANHGALSDRPFVLVVQPSTADPSRAPAGKHVLWAYCHVPHGCETDRTAVIEAQIERFAPGFRDRILARHVMSPKALEAFDPNLVGGDVGGGEADLRQFAARPVLSLRPWATPVKGLYLCSSATPPGGAVHGMGGYRAARLALRRT